MLRSIKKRETAVAVFPHSVCGHSDVTLPKCCYFIFKHFNKFEEIPSTCLRKWMNVWATPICQPGGANSVSAGIGTSTATLWLPAKYGSCKTVQSFQTKVKVTKHIVCEWWNKTSTELKRVLWAFLIVQSRAVLLRNSLSELCAEGAFFLLWLALYYITLKNITRF